MTLALNLAAAVVVVAAAAALVTAGAQGPRDICNARAFCKEVFSSS